MFLFIPAMEVQMIFFFIFIVINLSASEDMKRDLKGTEGGSITFPDPVVEFGFFLYERTIFAMVKNRRFEVLEESYKDRLLWNNKTGHFTITGLQKNDSGVYHIDSKTGNVFTTSYKLTVYESVPTPAVSTVSVSADGCTLLCSVKKAEEVMLLWIKDEEILNQTDSVSSLPLTVHEQDFSVFYRCVATNHVENKTLPVNVTTSCSQKNNISNRGSMDIRHYMIGGLVPLVLVAVIIMLIIKYKCFNKNKRTTRQTQAQVCLQAGWNHILPKVDQRLISNVMFLRTAQGQPELDFSRLDKLLYLPQVPPKTRKYPPV